MKKTQQSKKPFNLFWLIPVAFILPIALMLLTLYGLIPEFMEIDALTVLYLGIGLFIALAGIYLSASRVFVQRIKNSAKRKLALEILVVSLATAFLSLLISVFSLYASLAAVLVGATRLISLLNCYNSTGAKPMRSAAARPLRFKRRARARSPAVSVA